MREREHWVMAGRRRETWESIVKGGSEGGTQPRPSSCPCTGGQGRKIVKAGREGLYCLRVLCRGLETWNSL